MSAAAVERGGTTAGAPSAPRRRVTVLSGFLGAGKTTLLRAALRGADAGAGAERTRTEGAAAGSGVERTAVIINEFGDVALDHMFVDVVPDAALVVAGGCACCARRDELAGAVLHLLDLEQRGERPRSERLFIETSGLADPAPILFTLESDPVLRHHYVVEQVCVAVDAVNGQLHLDRHAESLKQVMVADRLVVTKTDLAGDEAVADLVARLRRLNPAARLELAAHGEVVREVALSSPGQDGPATAPGEPARGKAAPGEPVPGEGAPPAPSGHTADVTATALAAGGEGADWQAFAVWLSLLLHARGEEVLRVKGVLDVRGVGPVAVNGVQHVIHAPQHLSGSRPAGGLVIIARGVDPDLLKRSFHAFLRLGADAG